MSNIINYTKKIKVEHTKKEKTFGCDCPLPHFELNHQTRQVKCLDCGKIITPFDALAKLQICQVKKIDTEEAFLNRLIKTYQDKEKIKEDARNEYSPELRMIHSMQQLNQSPVCPNCKETINLKKVNTFKHLKEEQK